MAVLCSGACLSSSHTIEIIQTVQHQLCTRVTVVCPQLEHSDTGSESEVRRPTVQTPHPADVGPVALVQRRPGAAPVSFAPGEVRVFEARRPGAGGPGRDVGNLNLKELRDSRVTVVAKNVRPARSVSRESSG